jgi:oligoribonuclease
MAAEPLLVWMDLEMTGLDPAEHRIIEIATLITNGELEVVAEGPDLVVHQPEPVLANMNEWSRQHHAASGLSAKSRESGVGERDAELQTLAFIQSHCAPGSAPLAGNSIHVDRFFLRHQMPELEQYLHYRNIDVTTVKELARRWFPRAFASLPKKSESHRALDDIRESIAELRFYREHVFRSSEESREQSSRDSSDSPD